MAEGGAISCPLEVDTVALGERIGRVLRRGDLVLLTGPLGAGKTVLVRGVAVGAGADPRAVRSPTFVFHHVYAGREGPLHHIDLYRLGADADTTFLDVDGLLETGAVVVEWGELAAWPRHRPARIAMTVASGDVRVVRLDEAGDVRLTAVFDPGP